MASCCTGVTECQHLITIGFLNTFIGSDLQDDSGNTMTVTHPNGTAYCPTYSELTGGTLIQNWKQGSTPNGDRDGIIVSGSYSGTQCVNREDLSMKYTRFKEFSISVSPTTLSACGDSAVISYTHKYNRYTKGLNSTCEEAATPSVAEVSDTASGEVSYSSSNSVFTINGNVVSVGKNNPNGNGRSDDRSTTIGGLITFRTTDHTSEFVITQLGLTGSYQFLVTEYYIYNKRVVCAGGPEFICSGGSYSATAKHDIDSWDVYRWVDECGEAYNTDTERRNERTTTNVTYDTYSSAFTDVTGTLVEVDRRDSKSWDGYGSCSWHQYCQALPTPCENYTSYTEVNVSDVLPCTGGTVSITANVPYTAYTAYYENNVCLYNSSAGLSSVTISVTAGCNQTTSSKVITGSENYVNYTITQAAGPCCTPSTAYTYETVYIPCDKAVNLSVSARYTATTTDSCCNVSRPTGMTGNYTVNIDCNSGEERELTAAQKGNAPFVVKQRGGCYCECTGNCDSFQWVDGNEISFGCKSSVTKRLDYELTCASSKGVYNITVGSHSNLLDVSIVTGDTGGSLFITPNTNLRDAGFTGDTFTVSYDTGSVSGCTKTVNVVMEDTEDAYDVTSTYPDGYIDHTTSEGQTVVIFGDKRINITIRKK